LGFNDRSLLSARPATMTRARVGGNGAKANSYHVILLGGFSLACFFRISHATLAFGAEKLQLTQGAPDLPASLTLSKLRIQCPFFSKTRTY
jgi:hypothetical protein